MTCAPRPPTPLVRAATLDDIDGLVGLRRLMFELMGLDHSEPTWPAACAEHLREGLVDGTVAAFVADEPGHPGTLVAGGVGVVLRRMPGPRSPRGRHLHIQSMATEPPWQGRGLARQVVRELLAWAEAHGLTMVDLHASAEGAPIYRSLGFTDPPHPELRWTSPVR